MVRAVARAGDRRERRRVLAVGVGGEEADVPGAIVNQDAAAGGESDAEGPEAIGASREAGGEGGQA